MAFCQKCGQQIDDTVNNCPYCGALNASNPDAKKNNIMEKAKKLDVKKVGVLAGAVLAIVLVIVLISSILGGGGYKKAVDNFVDVTLSAKKGTVKALAPAEFWDYLEDEYDVEFDDVLDSFEDQVDDMTEMYEDEYGKNIKLSYKIEDTEDLDDDELDEIKDSLKEYGIKKKNVKAAMEVEVEVTYKGKEDKDSEESTITVVKIGSKWYVYEALQGVVMLAMWN